MKNNKERALEVLKKLRDAGIGIDDLILALSINPQETKQEVNVCKYQSYENRVLSYLNKMGVAANLSGKKYLVSAIIMLHEKPEYVSSIMKVYEKIGKKCGKSREQIARAITDTVKVLRENEKNGYMMKVFGKSIKTLTPKKFICGVSETLSWEKITEEVEDGKDDYELRVVKYLDKLGIPASSLGKRYLTDVFMTMHNAPKSDTKPILQKIYHVVAIKENTTVPCVEKTIRHTVENMCIHSDREFLQKTFGSLYSPVTENIKNSAFIFRVAEILDMKEDQ